MAAVSVDGAQCHPYVQVYDYWTSVSQVWLVGMGGLDQNVPIILEQFYTSPFPLLHSTNNIVRPYIELVSRESRSVSSRITYRFPFFLM